MEAGSVPVENPPNALSNVFISMVVSGCISPQEAVMLQHGRDEDDQTKTSAYFDDSSCWALMQQSVKFQQNCEGNFGNSVSSINDFSSYWDDECYIYEPRPCVKLPSGVSKREACLVERAKAA